MALGAYHDVPPAHETIVEIEIKPGIDSLLSVSVKHNIAVSEIKRVNGIASDNDIFARNLKTLKLPVPPNSALAAKYGGSRRSSAPGWRDPIHHRGVTDVGALSSSPQASNGGVSSSDEVSVAASSVADAAAACAAVATVGTRISAASAIAGTGAASAIAGTDANARKARKILRNYDRDLQKIVEANARFYATDGGGGGGSRYATTTIVKPLPRSSDAADAEVRQKSLLASPAFWVCCILVFIITTVIAVLLFAKYEFDLHEHIQKVIPGIKKSDYLGGDGNGDLLGKHSH